MSSALTKDHFEVAGMPISLHAITIAVLGNAFHQAPDAEVVEPLLSSSDLRTLVAPTTHVLLVRAYDEANNLFLSKELAGSELLAQREVPEV